MVGGYTVGNEDIPLHHCGGVRLFAFDIHGSVAATDKDIISHHVIPPVMLME